MTTSESVYERGPPQDQATARLAIAIKAVCPGEGASIGRWDDRSTWRLDAWPEATEAQIAAAHAVMAAFDPWGDSVAAPVGDFGPAVGLIEDEQTEYTEEEFAPVAVEEEAEQDSGDDEPSEPAQDASASEAGGPVQGEGLGDGSDSAGGGYSGILIERLPDELGARRNAVLAAITTEKLTRLKIAIDPSRAAFLAERFAEYQNRGALGLEIDDMLLADYRAYLAMKDRQERITNYAMQLEQSALDGDMDRLSAMHAGLGDGWP